MIRQNPTTNRSIGFEFSVSTRDSGTLEAAYVRFKKTKVAKTVEVIEAALLADYDRSGDLVGIEILAPVRVADMAKLVDERDRPAFRRMAMRIVPQDLIAA